MAHWITGHVVSNRQWSERLYSLRVDAEIEPFVAGQFIKLGLEIGDEIVGRPYSLVNPPHERPLEFYFIVLPGAPFSPALAALQAGDGILVAPRANGFLTLAEIPQARHLWLISTGTGIGPFLSILKTSTPWQCFERVVLVHAVRTMAELTYQDPIRQIAAAYPLRFSYVPFISREPSDFALSGRVPQAIANGLLETRAGIRFDAVESQVMLCGNPQMVEDTMNTLVGRGLKKHRRKEPGQISVENYW